MLQQLLRLRNALPAEQRISRIVVMGMGEPLANLPELLEALATATSPNGLGISGRNVTISTVGLPARIRELASQNRPYHLAVSLHAPNDELRRQIVPASKNAPLREILAAADDYRKRTGRQLTFEYVLLAGINDSPAHARELAQLLGRRDAFVNLIPFNPVTGLSYRTPKTEKTNEFASILRQAGFAVKIRKRKGSRIDAACGQLRRTADLSTPEMSTSHSSSPVLGAKENAW
jgi:23S rRNA (adenine2503-C2)-methyltransferase